MYQILLRMNWGFQSLFWGGEWPPLTSWGSLKNQIDHEKWYRGPRSPMIGCTNFSKNIRNFLKDVPRLPMFITGWEWPPFNSQEPPKYQMDYEKGYRSLGSSRIRCTNFLKDIPRIPKFVPRWGTTSNSFPRVPKGINGPWEWR